MLYTLKGEGRHQRSEHIETGIRKYVHLSSSSPYSTVQMLPPRDSQPLPSFMAISVCEIELLLQLLPPPSFSLPVWAQRWDEQEGIAVIITAIKTFKEIQECHTSDTPFLLLLTSLPKSRARLSCEEEWRDAAGHLISVGKAAFLFA